MRNVTRLGVGSEEYITSLFHSKNFALVDYFSTEYAQAKLTLEVYIDCFQYVTPKAPSKWAEGVGALQNSSITGSRQGSSVALWNGSREAHLWKIFGAACGVTMCFLGSETVLTELLSIDDIRAPGNTSCLRNIEYTALFAVLKFVCHKHISLRGIAESLLREILVWVSQNTFIALTRLEGSFRRGRSFPKNITRDFFSSCLKIKRRKTYPPGSNVRGKRRESQENVAVVRHSQIGGASDRDNGHRCRRVARAEVRAELLIRTVNQAMLSK